MNNAKETTVVIMLIGLKKPLRTGEVFPMTLDFQGGERRYRNSCKRAGGDYAKRRRASHKAQQDKD